MGYWIASAAVLLLYIAAAMVNQKDDAGKSRFNPLVITAGVHGRGSLSKLQIFFFSLIVVWMLAFFVVQKSALTNLSPTVLILLGVSAAGTVGSKVTAIGKYRLSLENWSWLMVKGWIKESIERKRRPPELADLMKSDSEFDVSKFQMLAISLVVGVAMVYLGIEAGTLADFTVPDNVLALLGLSQAVYIAGKAVGPPTNADLNRKLTEVRDLERQFVTAASKAWKAEPPKPSQATMTAAIQAAPGEYNRYTIAATEAAEMVQERIGAPEPPSNIDPALPKIAADAAAAAAG